MEEHIGICAECHKFLELSYYFHYTICYNCTDSIICEMEQYYNDQFDKEESETSSIEQVS